MKRSKLFLTLALSAGFVMMPSRVCAKKESGLASGTDLRLGYSDKVFSANLGYDIGYKWKNMIYLGVGPEVGFSTGNGVSAFSGGGYGKLRFTAPLNTEIKPFIEGRGGYLYNFKLENGDFVYGAGIGAKYKKIVVGLFLNISTVTTENVVRHSQLVTTYVRDPKRGTTTPIQHWQTSTSTEEESKTKFTPSFLIGFEF